jgi:hypothetical protein
MMRCSELTKIELRSSHRVIGQRPECRIVATIVEFWSSLSMRAPEGD